MNIRKALTFAIAFLLFLTLLFVSTCRGQARQFQIERVCIEGNCKTTTGIIAVTDHHLYIRTEHDKPADLQVTKHFTHKGMIYYRLEKVDLYSGFLVLTPNFDKASLILYVVNNQTLITIYYLKKDL